MIIKGGSRGAPTQLAWHLQRRDTNERVEILELQSPAPDLKEAFRDWQTLTEGTRGTRGLYHANIDPAANYTMTREQWQRAVDVLEKELGFDGQPRAVVMHEKHGRTHIHVVWARTDIDTMTLRPDSFNYLAHERASQKLELEFGHEPVPGKHAKRDREKQPEFPRAEANQAEWQQGERTGLDVAARKEQVTALKQSCDNGRTFKTALEEQGYILAKGDRRDFVIVDQAGSIHSLGRQIKDMKAAELRAFMKDVDREALPTAADAVDLQRKRRAEAPQPEPPKEEARPEETAAGEQKQQQEQQQKTEEQQQKPDEQKQQEQQAPATESVEQPSQSASDRVRAETDAIREAHARRQEEERRRIIETQKAELDQLRDDLERNLRENLDRRDANDRRDAQELRREQEDARGFVDAVWSFLSPARAAEQEAERQRARDELARRQQKERDDYARFLQEANEREIRQRNDRHAEALREHAAKGEEDLERYLQEQEAARKLRAEIEERERREEEELARDGPERPPPRVR